MFGKLYHIYSVYHIFSELDRLQNLNTCINENVLHTLKKHIFSGGCLNIKFAQWYISKIKNNNDDNSKQIVSFFEDIFEQCPRHDNKYTLQLFEKDFKIQLHNIIDIESLNCIASGSIGQVYKCKLLKPIYIIDTSHKNIKNIINYNNISINDLLHDYWFNYDNIPDCLKHISKQITYIALKIKHPRINEDIAYKVSCVDILTIMQKNLYLKSYLKLHVDFKDFINNLEQQIDFHNEYYNSFIFRKNFVGNYLTYFPRVLWCSENILITEFVESKDVNDISLYNQLKACTNFSCAISQMILIDNFCHGDIHDKNWGVTLYTDDKIQNEPRVIFYDYGICFKYIDKNFNIKIWEEFENCNVNGIIELSKQLIIGNYDEIEVEKDLNNIMQFYEKYSLDIINLIHNINNVLDKYNCKLSSILLNIVIILSLIESVLKKQNLIGCTTSINNNYNHKSILRNKQLDLIAYCNSKNIYTELTEYLLKKRQKQSSLNKLNKELINVNIFEQHNELDLDLPE